MIRLLSILLKLGLLICVVLTLAPQAKHVVEPYYFFDLPSHFVVQWTLFSAFAGLLFLYLGQPFWIAVSIFSTLFNLVIIVLQLIPSGGDVTPGLPTMKFMLANLNAHNYKPELLAKVLEEEDPDFISFLEVNTKWANQLMSLQRYYPHTYKLPLEGEFGIATFSRVPISNSKVEFLIDPQVPTITNVLPGRTGGIIVISTHAPVPLSQESYEKRNSHLKKLIEKVKTQTSPTVVLGNLNTSSFSPAYKTIIGESSLVNTRQGFGILPTWPMPFLPLAIPLDHILVTPELGVVDIHTTNSIGSDHKPIVVKLASAVLPEIPQS